MHVATCVVTIDVIRAMIENINLSSCRQSCEGSLRLWEVSLDIHLVHNALQLDFEGGSSSLLPNVSVHEYDTSSVVVLFATSSAVYRLMLPHPAAVVKVCVCVFEF